MRNMSRQIEVNPEMVVLARKARGKTQSALASAMGISQALLARYEAGSRMVTTAHLSALSLTLDYPQGFFTRHPRVEGSGRSEIFHRKRTKVSAGLMERAYAEAQIRRLEIGRMLESAPRSPLVPSYPIDEFEDDPEKIARTVRAYWQMPSGPVFNVTRTLEDNGCVILTHDFGSRHIDGFSHRTVGSPPFFHLNLSLPPDRWRWTLAHELGHVVMHFEPGESPKMVEKQADLFAAEFLAPGHELLPLLFRLNFQSLAALKREWKISMQALVMRAHHLGVLDARQKTGMFARLSKEGYRIREPETLDPPVEKPECPYRLVQFFLRNLGFSRAELYTMLHINMADFQAYYRDPEDLLGDILGFQPPESDAMEGGAVGNKSNSLDLGPDAYPLHIQIGCHSEDVIGLQMALDALHLLHREDLISEGVIDVSLGRLRQRMERDFELSRAVDTRWDDIDDLPF